MEIPHPKSLRIPTTKARDKLSEIIMQVQDPRSFCILTKHDKPMAAIVSMAELKRLYALDQIEDVVKYGERPIKFIYGKGTPDWMTRGEAAAHVQQTQMDRLTEREVLKGAGLEPVPGGEIEADVTVGRKKWWRFW